MINEDRQVIYDTWLAVATLTLIYATSHIHSMHSTSASGSKADIYRDAYVVVLVGTDSDVCQSKKRRPPRQEDPWSTTHLTKY